MKNHMMSAFRIEDLKISEDIKRLRIIFTSDKWGSSSIDNLCPACNKSPVQLLFTESLDLDGKYVIGQCLLCKQLVAYKGFVHDGKRSKIRTHTRKTIFGGNQSSRKKFEDFLKHLIFYQMPKHHVKHQSGKKKSDEKEEVETQMNLELCNT